MTPDPFHRWSREGHVFSIIYEYPQSLPTNRPLCLIPPHLLRFIPLRALCFFRSLYIKKSGQYPSTNNATLGASAEFVAVPGGTETGTRSRKESTQVEFDDGLGKSGCRG